MKTKKQTPNLQENLLQLNSKPLSQAEADLEGGQFRVLTHAEKQYMSPPPPEVCTP